MNTPLKPYMRVLAAEGAACVLIACTVWWIDPAKAISAVAGCLVFILPSAYFTLYALPRPGQDGSSRFLVSFFKGQFGKLILTALGFMLVFRFVSPLHVPSFFAIYGSLLVVHVISVAIWQNDIDRK